MVIKIITNFATESNETLTKNTTSNPQLKVIFNSYQRNQRKLFQSTNHEKTSHLTMKFNNNHVSQTRSQKHFRLIFEEHLKQDC